MNKPLFTLITIFVLSLSFSVDTKAQEKSVLDTLNPTTKNCNYVTNKLYEPFSDITNSFPGMKNLIQEGKNNTDCINVTEGTENLLKNLFTVAISIIIILTVINISVSGIQYMTQEAVGKKGEAKKRLQNSFIALGLGLLSYTILYTVNKQLVNFNFNPSEIDIDKSVDKGVASANRDVGTFSTFVGGIEVLTQTNAANRPDYQPSSGNNTFIEAYNTYGTVSAGAQKINDAALAMLGQTTCKVDFTKGGKLACAYVVNSIINEALGKPLRGTADETDTFGRSTIDMKKDLDNSKSFYFVGTSMGTLLPGDIVISPTTGENTGHVGIYTSTGKIVSNSSSRTVVDDHFTPTSWLSYYNDRKNLITYIYRLRP